MTQPQVRQFAGDWRIWRLDPLTRALTAVIPEPTDPYGNQPIEIDALSFSYEAGDEVRVVSKRRGSKYNQAVYSDVLPGVTSLSVTALEIPTALFARILYSETADASVEAGEVENVNYAVGNAGTPIQLANRYISDLVVKQGSATLAAGTDYKSDPDLLRRGQVVRIASGAMDPDLPISVSYSYSKLTGTRFLGGATPTDTFYIVGDLEDRISGEQGEMEIFEVKLTVDGDVDWMSAEPINPVLTGELVTPSDKPAPYVFTAYKTAA